MFGARADHRGLATLTALIHRHLQPAKTVVVDMGRHSPTAFHPVQYPGAETVAYDDLRAGNYNIDAFLDGLDVVVCFEVPYDDRLWDTARRRGVRTVCLVMPELDPWARHPELPRPDVIGLPTPWLAERYTDAAWLPVPAAQLALIPPGPDVVHVGALAMADRNGTRAVIEASARTRSSIVVRCQQAPDWPHHRAMVEVADVESSEDLFVGAALVVMPRRYGGLSLTIQEAMSAGLPVVVADTDPYALTLPPEATVSAVRGRDLHAKGGSIPTWDTDPQDLAAKIDTVMADADLRHYLAAASAEWATQNQWERLRPLWDAVLT